ncbi:MAG: hypothetical protein M3Q75_08920 [Gemmatimonadota bacterium]|nr:hypothetical protein [Gemmatimonadota bacterium]
MASGVGIDFPSDTWAARFKVATGVPIYEGGVPGDNVAGTPARQMATPAVLRNAFTIPTSGSVTIPNGAGASSAFNPFQKLVFQSLPPWNVLPASFSGVQGKLDKTDYGSIFTNYRFTPNAGQYPASPLVVPAGTAMTALEGLNRRGHAQIYWVGHNDVREGGTSLVVPAIAAMAAYNNSNPKRYIVFGLSNDNTSGSGTVLHTDILSVNASLSSAHGANYLEIRNYLISSGLAHAGIAPTAGDNADIAADIVPRSLRRSSNTGHLGKKGQQVVADLAVDKATALGWFTDAPPPPPPPPPPPGVAPSFFPFFGMDS